jgi:hypothetical protein
MGSRIRIRTDFKADAVECFMSTHGGEQVGFTGALATAIWFGLISGGKSSGPGYPVFNTIVVSVENDRDRSLGFRQEVSYGEHDYSLAVADGSYQVSLAFDGRFGKLTCKVRQPLLVQGMDREMTLRLVGSDAIEMSFDGAHCDFIQGK